MLLILLFIFILILFPFPFMFSMYYYKKKYYIKFYKFTLISNDKKNAISKKEHIKEKSEKKKKNITLLRIIKYIRSVNKAKYKPTFKTTGNIDYSLEDSSDTAIFFGLSSILYGFTYNFLSIFLKVKKYDIAINPLFKNQFYVKANIKCIVRVSIGHIIYMFYLILKEIIVEKVKKYE